LYRNDSVLCTLSTVESDLIALTTLQIINVLYMEYCTVGVDKINVIDFTLVLLLRGKFSWLLNVIDHYLLGETLN